MSEQRTFTSYGTAVANDADGAWVPDERAVRPAFPTDPYPAAGSDSDKVREGRRTEGESSDPSDDGRYVTFGCVDFRPPERA
ncbi:hypothetical protein [Halobaculum gomorrense]|uniref:Uncharacterized protein n=1 Tax=Halobaculum gomorrense TaxID=43928 RepID=A0A1M5UKG0_9EURY|nr:hypothetical protein [Halobaculum gomorrense]SHH63441.1 hypothetical protein SAMN05443636_3049 [Halobaculum gomorrense]